MEIYRAIDLNQFAGVSPKEVELGAPAWPDPKRASHCSDYKTLRDVLNSVGGRERDYLFDEMIPPELKQALVDRANAYRRELLTQLQ